MNTTPVSSPSSPIASSSNTHSHATHNHLSYPAPSPPAPSPPPVVHKETVLSKNRLYVGNIHSSVDEYAFLQVFSKFGKISNLDFLFNKNGPMKGKPRGYAFVEFKDEGDAAKALSAAHDRVLRGRKLVVTYAHQAPNPTEAYIAGGPGQSKYRKWNNETSKPTALSLLKSSSRTGKTEDRIAALEAKLQQMKDESQSSTSTSTPLHPSLPKKPPAIAGIAGADFNHSSPKIPKPKADFGSVSLGKKPTLDELMRNNQKTKSGILAKR